MAVTKTVRYHHFELVSRIMEIMGPRGKEKKKKTKPLTSSVGMRDNGDPWKIILCIMTCEPTMCILPAHHPLPKLVVIIRPSSL